MPALLNDPALMRIITRALEEDIGPGDATSLAVVPETARATLHFVTREPMVVAGLPVMPLVFKYLEPGVECVPQVEEGAFVQAGTRLLTVSGPARALLEGERTALNLWQRMAGVATLAREYVQVVEGTKAIILDTRKTIPGLRLLDKYACRIGGAQNHRIGLFDALLIKDNHLALAGCTLAEALRRAKASANGRMVEVECDTLAQVAEALAEGVDRILLDNMSLEMLRQAVRMSGGNTELEASGGVSLATVRSIAETGVDFISVGRLTHSAPAVDIGLDFIVEN